MNKITTRSIAIISLLIAILLVIIIPNSSINSPNPNITFRQDKLSIKTTNEVIDFNIEIAQNNQQREYGLMFRTNIPENYGMLFIWPRNMPIIMWMKNTPMPLDMLFIDEHGKIVYIAEKTVPYSEDNIDPGHEVRAVLELLGGTSAAKNIHVGDYVIHPYFKP